MHARRRREALGRLTSRRPESILVVCQGNVCRSPFAAALLGRGLGRQGIAVESAGFVGAGRAAPLEAVAAAARYDVDLTCHRSRPITPDVVQRASVVVVMDAAQQRAICAFFGRHLHDVLVLGDLDPERIDHRAIADPVHRPLEDFERSYGRIARCVQELVDALTPPR
jgi:protein-tyrosine phosphatase